MLCKCHWAYLLDLLRCGVWCLGVDCSLSPELSLEWVGEVATEDITEAVLELSAPSMYSAVEWHEPIFISCKHFPLIKQD